MNPIVEKERELSNYLEEWFAARFREWNEIYTNIYRDRRTGIYRLRSGNELLQLLTNIIENLNDHFSIEENQHIIPSQFSSIPQLLQFLGRFQQHIKDRYYLIEKNLRGEETDMIVIDIYKMCFDIDQMVTRCQSIYQTNDDIPIPYQQAKNALRNNNVKLFMALIGSLIKMYLIVFIKKNLTKGIFIQLFM